MAVLLKGESGQWRQAFEKFMSDWTSSALFITVHTSGSTGTPKNISLSKAMMRNSASATNRFFSISEKSRLLLPLSCDYIAGKMMIVRAELAHAQIDVIEPSSDALANIDSEYDLCAMVPLQLLTALEKGRTPQLSRIKNLIVGGGAVAPSLQKQLEKLPTAYFATYGMTETASHVAICALNDSAKRLIGSKDVYCALPGISFKQDDRSCLVIDAPMLLSEKIVTNDIVELISPCRFRWLGRYDNVINTGAIKVYPEQIEKKISGILDCDYYISSLPDDKLGNMVVMYIEHLPFDIDEIDRLTLNLSRVLSKYEVPKRLIFENSFQRTPSSKIIRK